MRLRLSFAALAAAALGLPRVAAASTPISSGEFRNTAHTLEKGTFVLHPILPSTYGISDNLDVKSSLLGLFGGPNASLEIGVIDTEAHVLSLEPALSTPWSFGLFTGGLTANNTLAMGTNRLNLQVGAVVTGLPSFETDEDGDLVAAETVWGFQVPVGVGYDLVKSDQVEWRFTGNANLVGIADSPAAVLGFTWNKALAQRFRLALGAAVYLGPNPLAGLPGGFFDDVKLLVLPLPQFELWWRF